MLPTFDELPEADKVVVQTDLVLLKLVNTKYTAMSLLVRAIVRIVSLWAVVSRGPLTCSII